MRMRFNPMAALAFAALIAGCTLAERTRIDRSKAQAPAATEQREPDERGTDAAEPLLARSGIDSREIAETFITATTPQDNLDSPAAWRAPNGRLWLLATAKQGDGLRIFDGDSGEPRGSFGRKGQALGEFRRPNGVAVFGDLAFVVERDNHRVQVLSLSLPPARDSRIGVEDTRAPQLRALSVFGQDQLRQPYGLWVSELRAGVLEIIVTDAYMAGKDGNGDDIAPPLSELNQRMQRYELRTDGATPVARHLGAFGDTSADGAIRVPESIWGDRAHDRLLIAEEDLATGTAIRDYTLDGRYRGVTIGRDRFKAQAEGIALWACADGSGYWIATDQYKDRSAFHVFDRVSLQPLGVFNGRSVANTDGVWLQQAGSMRFPDGVFYAVHDDQAVAAFDWREIARALNLRSRCEG